MHRAGASIRGNHESAGFGHVAVMFRPGLLAVAA